MGGKGDDQEEDGRLNEGQRVGESAEQSQVVLGRSKDNFTTPVIHFRKDVGGKTATIAQGYRVLLSSGEARHC